MQKSHIAMKYMEISSLVALPFLFLFLVHKLRIRTNPKTKKVQPQPPTLCPEWPVLGSLPEIMLANVPAQRWMHNLMEGHGTDIAKFRLGNTNIVVVNSPKIAREFLKANDAVFQSRPDTKASRADNIGFLSTALNPGGDQWKKMRRVMASDLLSQRRNQWQLHTRNEEADDLVRFVYNQCSNTPQGGAVVDFRSVMKHFPGNVMRRIIFGKKYFGEGREDGGPGLEEDEHVSSIFSMLFHFHAFSVSDYLPWLRPLDLDGNQRKIGDGMKVLYKYHDPIMKERTREWREGTRTEAEDLLDVMISLKDSRGNPLLSEHEIRGQVTEMFMAGIDNTYNIGVWAMSEMLHKPDIIEKAVKELDSVIGRDRLIQESDIPRLPYLMAIAREAIRIHPVAPFILPHVSSEDCTVAGYFIPQGTQVFLSRHGIGHNPDVWEDPLRFDPARHFDAKDLDEPELRFISFSRGRRSCVASTLGSSITAMLLGRLLHAFDWDLAKGVPSNIDFTAFYDSLISPTPLYASAKPRLSLSAYLSLLQ